MTVGREDLLGGLAFVCKRPKLVEMIVDKIPLSLINDQTTVFFTIFIKWWFDDRPSSGLDEVERLYDDLADQPGFQESVREIVEIIGKQV